MNKNFALITAGIIFGLVFIAHLMRIIYNVEITVSGEPMPMMASYVGLVVTFLLSIWMFAASRPHHRKK